MIELYTYGTPNGRKVSIMLEECALDYTVHAIDLMQRENYTPEFRKVSPNQRIPAIVDSDGPNGQPVRVFDSGAILQYLADKTGRLRGNDDITRLECRQWLQMALSDLPGPFGQVFHYRYMLPEGVSEQVADYGLERAREEMNRMVGALDFRLREFENLAKTYTIADIAAYPWIAAHEFFGLDLDDFVGVRNWYNRLSKRPNIQRGMNVPSPQSPQE
jgi:GST-like protein